MVGITILSIAVKEAIFQYTARAAKKLESTSMLADAWHHRSDAVSSVAVLIGLTGLFFDLWYLEPVATLAVSGIILAAAAQIVKTAVGQLTDRSAEKRLCDDMWEAAQAVPGVDAVDTLRTRVSSSVIFVEIEIAICADASVLARMTSPSKWRQKSNLSTLYRPLQRSCQSAAGQWYGKKLTKTHKRAGGPHGFPAL